MAYWFHRPVFKATVPVNFDLELSVLDSHALQICSETRLARARLLELMTNPNNDPALVEEALNKYLSYFQGFVTAVGEANGQSKLRHVLVFRWTHTMLGNKPTAQKDALFEMVSVYQDLAIWYMKHASAVAGKDEISMEEAKEVHVCLRKAAGLFIDTQEKYIGQLLERAEPGSDIDSSVVDAYIKQCTAEAQEVTIARAIELKHSPGLISSLAHETYKTFLTAAQIVSRIKSSKFDQWKKYFELKSMFYLSYAYCYHGENLLAQDKCGEAISSLKESQTCYQKARDLSKEYNTVKSPGFSAKINEHMFFIKLGPIVKRTLDKCERENGFIYHQKVPMQPPPLLEKASFGLATPVDFSLPPLNHLWTPTSYGSFDITKYHPANPSDLKQHAKGEKDLTPVKEVDVHQSEKEPKSESGCSVQ